MEDPIIIDKDEEELALEKLVFGDFTSFNDNLKKIDDLYEYSDEDLDDAELSDASDSAHSDDGFFIDEDMDVSSKHLLESDSDEILSDASSVAWDDSDDERLNISLTLSSKLKKLRKTEADSSINGKAYITRLRSQFEKIYPRPDWVDSLDDEIDPDNSDDEVPDSDDLPDTNALLEILASDATFIKTKQLKLISPTTLSITRLKDANYQKLSKSAIQSISFHDKHTLLLTGGFDRTARIYYIDGKINQFVTSLHLRNSPISTCKFLNDSIFIGGRRRYMNKWNVTNEGTIEKISRLYGHEKHQKSFEYFKVSSKNYIALTGNSGWCNILNSNGQWVKGFKIEGTIVDIEFSKDESFIIIANSQGEIWEYLLTSKKTNILRKWNDDGFGITKIALGGSKNRWLAIGTNTGVVNIYDRNSFIEGTNPKPFKSVENLITSISTLSFNSDGQLLVIASRAKRDALKIVHLPTASVYANWPTSGTPLGKVTVAEFSPNNEVLAIGNEGGKVTLWKLNHY